MYLKLGLIILLAGPALSDERLNVRMGKELFERNWVQAPSTTRASDGLGPLFNARACSACHPKGGAVEIENTGGVLQSIGLVARFESSQFDGDPVFGRQLQTASVSTLTPEGKVSLFASKPDVSLESGALHPSTRTSLRRAPTLAGRGLIDQITDAAIRANADPDDVDDDGVSGRINETPEGIGKFGWKAEHATLAGQIAAAFSMDMGLSSVHFPEHFADCTTAQQECRANFDGSDNLGDGFELSTMIIDLVSIYVASLGKERPGTKPGLQLFQATGCAACHVPTMDTETREVAVFSDLLLHDLGPGLSDSFDTNMARASEWRTAPLIGLVTSKSRLLHDGRAATVEEAIGWHQGEASKSQQSFEALSTEMKYQLLSFVEGL